MADAPSRASRTDCPRCMGEGQRTFNPSQPFDPQAETSELCRACNGTGYRDLHGYDADQDEWAETGPYSDWPRPRRIFPQADPGHPHSSCPSRAPSSSHKPDVASPVTSGRGEHLSDAA